MMRLCLGDAHAPWYSSAWRLLQHSIHKKKVHPLRADILAKHAIIPQQQFAYTTGKNASDITLVIDAIGSDLHSGRVS